MIGNIVRSIRGHDKGDFFVIVEKDEFYFYIADGDKRLINKAKKKNIKHVQVDKNYCDIELERKLIDKVCLDLDIKMALKRYKKKYGECEICPKMM